MKHFINKLMRLYIMMLLILFLVIIDTTLAKPFLTTQNDFVGPYNQFLQSPYDRFLRYSPLSQNYAHQYPISYQNLYKSPPLHPLNDLRRNNEPIQSNDYVINNDEVIHNQPQQYQLLKSAQDSSPLALQIQLGQQTIDEQNQNPQVSQQEINGPHVVVNDQQVLPPSEHLNNNDFTREQPFINHSDYEAIASHDVGENGHEEAAQNQFSSPVIVEQEQQQQDEIVQPSESANVAYSYHNLVLNPFDQVFPQVEFLFHHPMVLRVQHPNVLLNEMRHYKLQLDNSPIMNALFSPSTVPLPSRIVPWPSNFAAQRYLPPKETFNTNHKFPIKQQEDPQNYRRVLNNFRFPTMASPDSIHKSIHDSMAKNSGLFGNQFNFAFPAMPDIDNMIKNELSKIKSQPDNNSQSLVQIGNGNTNVNQVSQVDSDGNMHQVTNIQMNDEENENEATPEVEEEATTEWNSSLKIMNQIATTESATESSATEVETTANPSPMNSDESAKLSLAFTTENSSTAEETTELKINEETVATTQIDEQIMTTSESSMSTVADVEVTTTNSSTDDYQATTTTDSETTVSSSEETSTIEVTTTVN